MMDLGLLGRCHLTGDLHPVASLTDAQLRLAVAGILLLGH